jgi:hypothetical protein
MLTLSRRNLVTSAAALPALAVPAVAASQSADDTFDRIQEHRQLAAMIETEMCEDWSRFDEIAWSFVERPPTTVAGIAAVLKYVIEHRERGFQWPDGPPLIENDVHYHDWEIHLIRAAGNALSSMVQS